MEEIEQERQKAVLEMQKQIAALAIMAAEKILEKQNNRRRYIKIPLKLTDLKKQIKFQVKRDIVNIKRDLLSTL